MLSTGARRAPSPLRLSFVNLPYEPVLRIGSGQNQVLSCLEVPSRTSLFLVRKGFEEQMLG